jgi:hypothetical protein
MTADERHAGQWRRRIAFDVRSVRNDRSQPIAENAAKIGYKPEGS